uniref:Heat shock protein 70 n=1 Tax=Tetraselmis sp. GSL018 TaxID=582737 RepID=A0A061RT88_9CHLO
MDCAIASEFQAICRDAHGVTLAPGTRAWNRLLIESEKVKRTLSTIAETFTVLECVGDDERDIKLTMSQARFEELCADQRRELCSLVEAALSEAGVAPEAVSTVELVGGATRVPWVRKAAAGQLSSATWWTARPALPSAPRSWARRRSSRPRLRMGSRTRQPCRS